MSLWNPFALDVLGQPMAPVVPPALRVEGGQASPAQLAMAQQSFARFVSHARLSQAPNPTQIGKLADGTAYRITVVCNSTVMQIWPVQKPTVRGVSGIGVTTAAGSWLLRPPGNLLQPGGGVWSAEKVGVIYGGVVFVFLPTQDYFVESPAGLSRGNQKLSNSILGATGSRYVRAGASFPTSSLFMGKAAVKQVRVADGTLRLGQRAVNKGVPSQTLTTSDHALPVIEQGDYWDMVSSNPTGTSIQVCRIATDPDASTEGATPTRVCAAVELTCPDSLTSEHSAMAVTSVQELVADVAVRVPDLVGGKAPQMSAWSKSHEDGYVDYTVTISNPNPNPPGRTFTLDARTYLRKSGFEERADFESTSIYRAYIGGLGNPIMDGLKRRDFSLIDTRADQTSGGYESEIWVDYRYNDNASQKVAVDRFDELSLGSEQKIKLYAMKIDFDYLLDGDSYARTYFLRYRYNEAGEIVGFIFGGAARVSGLATTTCKMERSGETVLLFDDQFKVAVSVKVSLTFEHMAQKGVVPITRTDTGELSSVQQREFDDVFVTALNRGSASFPSIDENETSTKGTVTLEVLHEGRRTTTNLTPPAWLRQRSNQAMGALFLEIQQAGVSSRTSLDSTEDPTGDTGVRKNRFYQEEALGGVVRDVFAEQLGSVMYAKDPKTGAGFLSFEWAGKSYNYVVGSWGVASSASRTDIAQNAAIGALQSV